MKITGVSADAPVLRKLPSTDDWEYVASWRCVVRTKKDGAFIVSIAPGYKTDLASVPRALRGAFDNGSGSFGVLVASQIHDMFYSTHYLSRSFADSLFYEVLRWYGVGCLKARLYYLAVDLFGGTPWDRAEGHLEHDRELCRFEWVDRA